MMILSEHLPELELESSEPLVNDNQLILNPMSLMVLSVTK